MKNQLLPRTSEPVRWASLRSLAIFVSLALSAWLVTPASAVDVELFGVHKGQAFVQTNNAAPVAAGSSNYFFTAFARAKAFNSMRDARVRVQGDVDHRLPLGHDFAYYNFWSQTDFYASQAALDAVVKEVEAFEVDDHRGVEQPLSVSVFSHEVSGPDRHVRRGRHGSGLHR